MWFSNMIIAVGMPLLAALIYILGFASNSELFVLWFALLFISSVSIYFNNPDLELFHPGVGFPFAYLFLYGMGALFLYYNDSPYVSTLAMYAAVGMVSYQSGVSFTNGLALNYNFQVQFYINLAAREFLIVLISLTLVSLAAALYIYTKIGIPIFSSDLFKTRHEDFAVVSHYSLFLMRNVSIAFNFYMYYLVLSGSHARNPLILPIAFIFSFLILFSTSGRADVVTLVLLFLINYHYLARRFKISQFFGIGLILLVIIIGFNYYRLFTYGGEHETLSFLSFQFNNPVIEFLYHVFAQTSLVGTTFQDVIIYVPAVMDYFNGGLIPQTLSTYLPGHQAPPGEILKEVAGLDFTGGQANLTLIGDFYSDFGFFGICIGMFTLGGVVSLLYRRLLMYKTIGLQMLYSYTVFSLIIGIPGGLFSQAIRYYYYVIIIFVILASRVNNSVFSTKQEGLSWK